MFPGSTSSTLAIEIYVAREIVESTSSNVAIEIYVAREIIK